MAKTIEAIYEDGVLKPLIPLDLREHERVKIVLQEREGAARATSGMIKGLDPKWVDKIALSPDFLPEGE